MGDKLLSDYEIENLETLCRLTQPEFWRYHDNGTSLVCVTSEKHESGTGTFARATDTEAQAIAAFGNAMPRLLSELRSARSTESSEAA